eukprot:3120330-Alexandrium_andersonii.AAC.1
MKLARLQTTVSQFRQVFAAGRIDAYMFDSGRGFPIRVYNMYMWTGSQAKEAPRAMTARAMDCILDDAMTHSDVPFIILGDMNCEPDVLPRLQTLMQE